MISVNELQETAREILGDLMGNDFPYDKVAETLNGYEAALAIRLSCYGFVMWAVDSKGYKCAYSNVMASPKTAEGYASAARKLRDDMPCMLVNASIYVTNVLSNVSDMDTCLDQLEGMTFPYVLYVLFAGSGQEDVVRRYRPEMTEHMRRYPSTLDRLPETYRKVGREVLDADADKR